MAGFKSSTLVGPGVFAAPFWQRLRGNPREFGDMGALNRTQLMSQK